MAKRKIKRSNTKKRRKVDRMFKGAMILFVFSIVATIGCRLFLRQEINSLSIKIQDTKQQIEVIKEENIQLQMDIQTLSSKDRVYKIAEASGLKYNRDNIMSVVDKYDEERVNTVNGTE